MTNGTQKRTRSQRVASIELPGGRWTELWRNLRRASVLLRLALCAMTAIVLLAMTRGWNPPPSYRADRLSMRDIVARTDFSQIDETRTLQARELARSLTIAVYDHDPQPLSQLRAELQNELAQILVAESHAEVDPELWDGFCPPLAEGTPSPTLDEKKSQFDQFKETLTVEGASEQVKMALEDVFAPFEQHGLMLALPPEHDANQESIAVRPVGRTEFDTVFPLSEVLLENATNQLQRSLAQKLPTLDVADRLFAWLRPRLPITLRLNQEATHELQDQAALEVEPKRRVFLPGEPIAKAGVRLSEEQLALLALEYQQELLNRDFLSKLRLATAVLGMYVALFIVGGYFVSRFDPEIVSDLPHLITLLATLLATVGAMLLSHANGWRAEVIPLLLFGMTVVIASRQDVALLLASAVTLISVVAMGQDLADAVILLATTTGAILSLDSIRTRSKLLVVGFFAAIVGFFTTLGVGTLTGQPMSQTMQMALMISLWSIIAGSLMTCLLPLVERIFGVQTDLSLIELGDPAHPLLQELIRRAPGTYNHSITVASLAQSAAESIGARGLLVRVGAYFHDIGKMLKPGYFVENQGQGDNRHGSLVPAMSTLVIIAHVKDGADLARQNKLPECIIDFIQQHHGTTLVEYFYRQAANRKSSDPDAAEVDESSFRYPGPKPQSKEAGVLMLADAVESASRVLVEPTPSRIKSLVEEITRKRLDDGQFDECGLTLQELRLIGDSLVKSLTAVYHGRVKYPDQETA